MQDYKIGTEQAVVGDMQITIGGDIIIAINGTRITGIDNMSAYLEEYTLPGQTVNLTVVRDKQTIYVPLELGSRPATTNAT
jgi:serine protease Do